MASFFDPDEVVPLIEIEGGVYRAHEPTLQWLSSIKKPLAVIACAGKYRTGKSYLLNCLCETTSEAGGFAVGDTVQACTKGIWLYRKPLQETEDRVVLVVDTEGIESLDAEDMHDVRIFTLALLLSCSFLYNSMGALDEAALSTLSLATKISAVVRAKGGDAPGVDANEALDHAALYWARDSGPARVAAAGVHGGRVPRGGAERRGRLRPEGPRAPRRARRSRGARC